MKTIIESTLHSIFDSVSTNEILYDYDASKLYLELSRNEARSMFNNPELFAKAFDLSTRINDVSGLINGRHKAFKEIEQQLSVYKLDIEEFDSLLYRNYLKQWLFPVEALLSYRNGDFEKAETQTIEAIYLVDELILDQELNAFLFRLILQNSNLATLYLYSDNHEKAYQIWNGILDYLFNGNISSAIYGNACKKESLWDEMIFLREYNAYYYFKTFVDKISKSKQQNHQTYSDSFESVLKPLFDLDVFTEERYLINTWINVEWHFISNDYPAFLEGLKSFFNDDVDESFDFLKIHLLDSLILVLQKMEFSGYENYYNEILALKLKLSKNRNLDVINTSVKNP